MSETNEVIAAESTAVAAAPVVLTKAEKIARLEAQIAKLQARLSDVINDVVRVKAEKVVALPEIGAEVLFTYGRTTANTAPQQRIGKVVAIKPAGMNGDKRVAAQIKVSYGEGFDQEFAVIYPAQIVDSAPVAEAQDE